MPERSPSEAPTPTAPDLTAGAAYVEWGDAGFTVIASAEADALFDDTQTCANDVGGYSVEFPATWFTNEPGEAPPCSWFSAQSPESGTARLVALSAPAHVPIWIKIFEGGIGQIPEWPRLLTEEVAIDGLGGHRTEDLAPGRPPELMYGYSVWLDANPTGLKLTAGTSSAADGDYELNKAVLDRMMSTLEFDEAP